MTAARLRARLGFRGAILTVGGLGWLIAGLTTEGRSEDARAHGLHLVADHLPAVWRSLAWIMTALLAMAWAWRRARSGTGFVWLAIMPVFTGVTWALALAESIAHHQIYTEALSELALRVVMILGLLVLYRWPEPVTTIRVPRGAL